MNYLPERDILLLLLNFAYYEQYFRYIDIQSIKDNYKELSYLFLTLQKLHDEYPYIDHTLDELRARFFVDYPDADKELYLVLFKTLQDTTLGENVGVGILEAIKRRKQALHLSEMAFRFSNGNGSLDKVISAYQSLDAIDSLESDEIQGSVTDLDHVLDKAVLATGLRWRLDCLNKSLGSLRPGDFGFIFKRPESGGTALCASEFSHMLKNSTGTCIWINNEEQDEKVITRIYQSFFGITLEQLLSDRSRYKSEFNNSVGDRFKFFGPEYSNRESIERIIRQTSPILVVYDQLDEVKGFDADRNDLKLGEIYKWARQLAKSGHAAIGVTQADGTAENQKWLTMQHVSEAKTTKQAAADWIIGMGMQHAEGAEYTRYLNICKNKLLGDSDTINSLRHGKLEVIIQPEIMRFMDIITY